MLSPGPEPVPWVGNWVVVWASSITGWGLERENRQGEAANMGGKWLEWASGGEDRKHGGRGQGE